MVQTHYPILSYNFMWTPIEIFCLTFLFNHSPMANERLSVKEVIENREAQLIIESVTLRNDSQTN